MPAIAQRERFVSRLTITVVAAVCVAACVVAFMGRAAAQAPEAQGGHRTLQVLEPYSLPGTNDGTNDDTNDEETITELSASLTREINRRLGELWRCRDRVAMQQGLLVKSVPPTQVAVRFLLLPDGTVEETSVVAVSPTRPAVLVCLDRHVQSWHFDEGPEQPVWIREETSLVRHPLWIDDEEEAAVEPAPLSPEPQDDDGDREEKPSDIQ